MEAIPLATREKIIALYAQGRTTRDIALDTGFCLAAVRRVRQHFHERGTLVPQTHKCGRKGYLTPERQQLLRSLRAVHPDATLAELCRHMDIPIALSTMDAWLKKLGLPLATQRRGQARVLVG